MGEKIAGLDSTKIESGLLANADIFPASWLGGLATNEYLTLS